MCAAGDDDVLVGRRLPGLLERGAYPRGDEVEGGATLHRQRVASMVGKDKHGDVIWGVVAPPALPFLVPLAIAAAKHLAPHDVGADILDDLVKYLRIDGALAT